MRLKDKVAIITGAGSGIGRATAILFAREGARVVCANRTVETGNAVVAEIEAEGGEAIFVPTDVSQADQVERMVQAAVDRFGRVDILFNNAASGGGGLIKNLTEEGWDRVIDICLKSVFLCSRAVLPHMLGQGGGVIINNSSVLGVMPMAGTAAYSAAKAGILAFTRSLAIEFAKDNIRANCVVPGSVDTPMLWGNLPEEEKAAVGAEIAAAAPINRIGDPMELAYPVLFLATEEASFCAGMALLVDGGLLSRNPSPR